MKFKERTKRMLSLLLAVCLMVSLLPQTAYATDRIVTESVEEGSIVTDLAEEDSSVLNSQEEEGEIEVEEVSSNLPLRGESVNIEEKEVSSALPLQGEAEVSDGENVISGYCGAEEDGSNLIWTWEEATGTLTITGEGAMADYESNNRPWEEYKKQITTVIVEGQVTKLGTYAFYYFINLENVTLTDSIREISESAFNGCRALESVILPASVTTIGQYAFFRCILLQNLSIPDGVVNIGDQAFALCTALESITIPRSVTSIGEGGFNLCDSLKTVNVPCDWDGSLYTFAEGVEVKKESHNMNSNGQCEACSIPGGYCGAKEDGSNLIWTWEEATGTLTITGEGAMANYMFNNRPWEEYKDHVITLIVENGVTKLGNSAFYDFSNLENVSLADSILEIPYQAFGWCDKKLTTLTLPSNLVTIGNGAFYYCTSLVEVYIPSSVNSIGTSVFRNTSAVITVSEENPRYEAIEGVLLDKEQGKLLYCPASKSGTYRIPNGVVSIEEFAFCTCSSLENVIFPDSLKSIGKNAFTYCESLQNIILPLGVEIIEQETFSNCILLKNVIIPNSVTTIHGDAFLGCVSLESISIPKSVTSITNNPFRGCSALSTVNVPCDWDGSLYTFEERVEVKVAPHSFDENGQCENCEHLCDHSGHTSERCDTCSMTDERIHTVSYQASSNVITVACSGNCGHEGNIIITAANKVYDGAKIAVTVEQTGILEEVILSPVYREKEGKTLEGAPVDAGVYTISLTYEEASVAIDFEITKAAPEVTAPVVVEDLVYNGLEQTLLRAGTTTGGTLLYKMGDGEWSESLPKAEKPGTYTLWYKVTGGRNYQDTDEQSLTAVIEKAEAQTFAAEIKIDNNVAYTYTMDLSAYQPEGEHVSFGREATYTITSTNFTETDYYEDDSARIQSSSLVLPIRQVASDREGKIGELTILIQSENYEDSTLTITVSSKNRTVVDHKIRVSVADLIYGSLPEPVYELQSEESGEPVWRLTYSKDGGESWHGLDTLLEEGKLPVGEYRLRVYYEDDSQMGETTAEFQVQKAMAQVTLAPQGKELVYNGSEQELVTAGEAMGGELQYSLDGEAFVSSLPKAVNANTVGYSVYYKVVGDQNHNDTTPQRIIVVIQKAPSAVETVPVAVEDLVYTGTARELVTAGAGLHGELHYRLDGAEYTAEIPMGTEAGEYTVYYKVVGEENYQDTEAQSLTVTIRKAALSLGEEPEAADLIYGQSLESSQLSGGHILGNGSPMEGQWYWKDNSLRPEVSGSYGAFFVPEDQKNYENYEGQSLSVRVVAGKPEVEISVEPKEILSGQEVRVSAVAKNPYEPSLLEVPKILSLTWQVGEEEAKPVENGFLLLPKDLPAGTKLTITAVTNAVEGKYQETSVSNTFDVIPVPEGIWITEFGQMTYTGSAITPSFKVYDGEKLLQEKTDYTVTYKNNKNAYTWLEEDYKAFEANLQATGKKVKTGTFDPKKAPQMVLKMKGNYSGTKVVYFAIAPADLTTEDFKAEDLTVTYTGKKQTPAPVVEWNGKKLTYGKDFSVPEYDAAKSDKTTYVNPKEEPYGLTIKGEKNFTGELPITLTISKDKQQIAMGKVKVTGVKNYAWSGEQISQNNLKVSYGKDVLVEETAPAEGEYLVTYGENKEVGTGSVTVMGTGKDVDGDGLSYIGRKTVTFKITGTSFSKAVISGLEKSYFYTGKEIQPKAVVSLKAAGEQEVKTLVEGVDYSCSYEKNIEKGTATILFTGLESSGYTGTKKQTFKIVPASFGEAETAGGFSVSFHHAEKMQDGIYVASHVKGGAQPKISVSFNELPMEQGKDYTVTYSNHKKPALSTDAKAPTLTIKGKGNFAGTKKITFTIVPKALTAENGIQVVIKDKTVNKKPGSYRQNFQLLDEDGKALGKADYDASKVTYTLIETPGEEGKPKEENVLLDGTSVVAAGSTIRVTVPGKGLYAGGEVSGTYRILEKGYDISKAVIQIENQEYTGSPIEILSQEQFKTGKVYLKIGSNVRELVLGTDIEVVRGSYVKNETKGTAKVTFQGLGDLGGTKTVSYKITGRVVESFWKGIRNWMEQWMK